MKKYNKRIIELTLTLVASGQYSIQEGVKQIISWQANSKVFNWWSFNIGMAVGGLIVILLLAAGI